MIFLDEIAAAMVTELTTQATVWGVTYTASRSYLDHIQLSGTDTLTVTVNPSVKTRSGLTRGLTDEEPVFELAFIKRVADSSNATVDPLVRIVERVQEFFTDGHGLTGLTNIWAAGDAELNPVFDDISLYTESLFFSILTVTLRATQ